TAYDTPALAGPLLPQMDVEKVGRTTQRTHGKVIAELYSARARTSMVVPSRRPIRWAPRAPPRPVPTVSCLRATRSLRNHFQKMLARDPSARACRPQRSRPSRVTHRLGRGALWLTALPLSIFWSGCVRAACGY